jgi:lantibiotic modifying enzyme
MMNDMVRTQLLDEAIRIGDELLEQAEHHASGMVWHTLALDPSDWRRVRWHQSANLYDGVAGIVLFFLELYAQTQHESYRHAAIEGLRWVEHQYQSPAADAYAFYTGCLGVAYVMRRMAAVTQDDRLIASALHMVRSTPDLSTASTAVNDVLKGTAGTVLGLLHLYDASGEPWLLDLIDRGIQGLLRHVHLGSQGVYWDPSPQTVRGLCGFSHGAAGIGFVFLELGHYFRNEAFCDLAEQAFLYESAYYDAQQQNWPDFRKGRLKPGDDRPYRDAYAAGDLIFFTSGRDMNAWCHGAAGIGLTRLRAYELLQRERYLRDSRNAIEKTTRTDAADERVPSSASLCHGSGGNAELFIDAYRVFQDASYLGLAMQVADQMRRSKNETERYQSGYHQAPDQEDTSLFLGNAGIGHFYLRLLEPLHTPSILAPRLCSQLGDAGAISKYRYISLDVSTLHKHLTASHFPRTLSMMEQHDPVRLSRYFHYHRTRHWHSPKQNFMQYMQHEIPMLPRSVKSQISEICHFEIAKSHLDEQIVSYAWLYMKERFQADHAKTLSELSKKEFLELNLILAPEIVMQVNQWHWPQHGASHWQTNLHTAPDQYPVLLRPTSQGVMETPLTPFSFMTLAAFRQPNRVAHAICDVANQIDQAMDREREAAVQACLIGQIKAALAGGVLTVYHETPEAKPCGLFNAIDQP